MYICEVIPLTKIPFPNPQILTYFSPQQIPKGATLEIPLHNRSVVGIVRECRILKTEKLTVKRAGFQMKNIRRVINPNPVLSRTELDLAEFISRYYFTPLGLVFKSQLPNYLFRRLRAWEKLEGVKEDVRERRKGGTTLLWSENRDLVYREAVGRVLKNGGQALILAPELNRLPHFLSLFRKITTDTAALSNTLTDKQYFENWFAFRKGSLRVLVGTRSSVFAYAPNLELIIVDEEEHSSYISWEQHPRYNARDVAIRLAEESGARVILGSSFPSLESYWGTKTKRYALKKIQDSKPMPCTISVIDMRAELKKGNYSVFSEELRNALRKTFRKKSGKAILFINRRGFSPIILCRECGHVLHCKNCEAPLVYHQTSGGSAVLICHHCNAREKPPNVCPGCGGFRIRQFGAGTERVEEEFKKEFSRIPFIRIDSDSAPRVEEQVEILEKFAKGKVRVLIGTQLLLKRDLLSRGDTVAVVSIEPMLNFPDFRSGERSLRLLRGLGRFAKRNFILQTYSPDHYIFKHLYSHDESQFFEEELGARKEFSWPPFCEVTKLTYSHPNFDKAKQEAEILRERLNTQIRHLEKFRNLSPTAFQLLGPAPAFIPKVRGKYVFHLLIKFRDSSYDDTVMELRNKILGIVPNSWTIDVDPVEIV